MKLLLLFLLAALTCPRAFAEDDVKALQGTWKPEKAELGGEALPADALQQIVLKITENAYKVTISGEDQNDEGTFVVDTAAKPKTMTVKSVKGANEGKTFLAIYELDGDVFRVCYALEGTKFPTEFASPKDSHFFFITYRRQKN